MSDYLVFWMRNNALPLVVEPKQEKRVEKYLRRLRHKRRRK